MPSVNEVRSKIWNKDSVLNLFDDGEYSAIWGTIESETTRSLGVRWNGNDNYIGYPNQGKNAVWYSEPRFLEHAILSTLLAKTKEMSSNEKTEQYKNNILVALSECNS